MHLRWRTVVVTGAGAGLGREIALRFARAGAGVVAVDRDRAAADDTAGLLRACRVQAWSVQADVTSEDDLGLLAARLRDLGGADVLVNNAGGWTPGDQFPDAAPESWSATLDLNLRAPMRLTQLFLDGLDDRRGRVGEPGEPGAVVNVSSSAALGDEPYGSSEYAAAQAGLVRFTTSMARPEVAARARVTCVVPGRVALARAPFRVAGAVVDLAQRGAAGTVVELL